MSSDANCRSDPMPAAAEAREARVMWSSGWQRYAFPAWWMFYLFQVVAGVHSYSHGTATVVGYLIVAAFAVTYLAALPMGMTGRLTAFWALYGFALALMIAEAWIARQDALVFCVYLAVLSTSSRQRVAAGLVITLSVAAGATPALVRSWHLGVDWGTSLTVLLVAFAMWGFFGIMQANRSLAEARAQIARLAAENERSRIARDLHDLLGHSLTTVTVKAGLARRLAERGDYARAGTEIAEVETLARRTLGDVRAAVAGHHDVTITGELATAREVLRAAGIMAELPGSVDVVAPELAETFGWVLREGTTNVVRHSRARHCRVELTERSIAISDDGRGGAAGGWGQPDEPGGSGLVGLRARVQDVGGTLVAGGSDAGYQLRVEVPVAAGSAASGASAAPVARTASTDDADDSVATSA